MGCFYFDDSKHERLGQFALGALVFHGEDPTPKIEQAIRAVGLEPFKDEFKSSANMSRRPEQAALREQLFAIGGRIALVVCPYSAVGELGTYGLRAIETILQNETALARMEHDAFFDAEIFGSVSKANERFRSSALVGRVRGHFEQDSAKILGIQLADLVAHTCSQMLLEQFGLKEKWVKAGENSGYDPEIEVNLGFELWARTRYNWFTGPSPIIPDEGPIEIEHMTVPVLGYGLIIAEECQTELKRAAESRFGSMYMGCIH
ncbi:hypothetical protein EJ065_5924 [Corallococcus coralloides]|uniref:DUF3800 domain-containing protein n=1 Tax=Corallococcus coralloides TaxID=184914 RepID=A0A410RZT7_CORCK|nr:hypothetical protein [Corallococcus coralloides]QAT87454.1 hypothetical protein EJ065_5924 [Corallococcus coralloides]